MCAAVRESRLLAAICSAEIHCQLLSNAAVDNYFNYFTEIEEHFQRRRGTLLLLSTLDWALIETWKDAGIPLEAVLRGIDAAFDKWERRPSQTRKVNGLAYCSQEVLAASEEMQEAEVGAAGRKRTGKESPGFENATIAAYLKRNAETLMRAAAPAAAEGMTREAGAALKELAALGRRRAGQTARGRAGAAADCDGREALRRAADGDCR